MRRRAFKGIGWAAIVALALTMLAACESGDDGGNPDAGGGPSGKPTEITFWNANTGPDRVVLESIIKKFNDSHEDVQVNMDIMPNNTMLEKLTASSATNSSPDLVALNTNEMRKYKNLGMLLPYDGIYGTTANLDPEFIPDGFAKAMKIDDKHYGFPFFYISIALYYNKDLFEAAGLDPNAPPTNRDELIDYAIKLTDASKGQYGLPLGLKETVPNWPVLLWGNGGDVVDANGNVVVNDKTTVDAVQLFTGLIRDNKISPPSPTGLEVAKLFKAGKAGFMMNGPWEIAALEEAGVNFGLAQIPAGPANDVSYGDPVVLAMTTSAKDKEDAVAVFLDYWMSKEIQIEWALGSGYPPARPDAVEDPALADKPYIKQYGAALQKSRMHLMGLSVAGQIDTEAFIPALESIVLQNADVQKKLDEAAAKIEALLPTK